MGEDAGGWFDTDIGEREDPKSISHEHTFGVDTAEAALLESTLAQLSEMVGRRLREHDLHARTVNIKLRYSDFTTLTRAVTLDHGTQLDIELMEASRMLFRRNWNGGKVRLLGVNASGLESREGQLNLLDSEKQERWRKALGAMDKLRDRYGESSVSLAAGMRGRWKEKVHENPASLPGKEPRKNTKGRE